MPRDIAAVICDMDGLLVDSEPLYQRAWQTAARLLGFELSDEFYLAMVVQTEADAVVQLRDRFGAAFPVTEVQAEWKAYWSRLIREGELHAKPGAIEC